MRKFIVAATVAVAFLCGSANSAEATFQMRISTSSGFSTTITDLGGTGVITFNGTAGNFSINVDTGLSRPALGSAAAPNMDLNFLARKVGNSDADVLTIEISDQGYTTSPLPINTQIAGTFSGSVTQVVASAFFDNGNALYMNGGGSTYSQTFTTTPFSGTGSFNVSGAAPYSLTEKIVITGGVGGGLSSGDFEINAAPAPAGLVLALSGMPALGLGAWIRRRRSAIVA